MKEWLLRNNRTLAEFIVLIAITSFLFTYFKPELVFSPTHISAGDTVGHYYGMYYMNKVLLPAGEIIGWCPNWFLGYPMFHFYFPAVFAVGAFLGYIVALPVAFKIITVLGTFMLPICAFICFRLMKFDFPVPLMAALFTLPFLFLENYSMWGGNIPSTLAGEFAYVFSLSLMLILIGSLYRGIKKGKHIILNAGLFAIVMLAHVFPAIFAAGSSIFFLLDRKNLKKNFIYLAKTFGLGTALAGFWFFPMIAKSAYTVPHMWFLPNTFSELWKMLFVSDPGKFFPLPLFGLIAILGFAIAAKKRDDRIFYFAFSIGISFIGLLASGFLNSTGLELFRQFQFIKFIPILYLFIFLTASYVTSLLCRLKGLWVMPLVGLILMIFLINNGIPYARGNWNDNYNGVTYIQHWINWNYGGYEDKKAGREYFAANDFLSTLKEGRVVFEYDPEKYDSTLGSSRATETIPAFSGRPITEGTHFQSAVNGPYIYFAHCEYSNGCSCVFGPETGGCTGFDMEAATTHLELFNVKHLFVSSDKLKQALRRDRRYKMLYGPGIFEIWELTTHEGKYVTLPDYYPVYFDSKEWRNTSYLWFRNYRYNDIPIVWGRGEKADSNFHYVLKEIDDFSNLPMEKIEKDCYIEEQVERKEIKIRTSCIGKPLLIKISYFPNWQVEGADKIYMVSPAFMMIFPKQENVKIYYGWTWADILGTGATLVTVSIIIIHIAGKRSKNSIIKRINKITNLPYN